ncbi:unnamed protein product [Prorocentrum cordatum]|uniref:RNA-directed RNA polymerase n=1 Tax=Prorocentrum cordatum TaxID=2364126 RepID=A0ABN9UYF0_9DINO|nr:unnamed protein product [Polarella glacialis]
MAQVPAGHWAVLTLVLLHLSAHFLPEAPPSPGLLPCALEAVCPPAWLPPHGADVCPPCPEAPPCEAAPAVCAAAEPASKESADPLGTLLAAAPGVLVALALEACPPRLRVLSGMALFPHGVEQEYSDDPVDHERVLLYPSLPPGTWAARTPDGDEFEEDFTGADPQTGPEGAALMPIGGGAPEGWPRPIYRFRAALTAEELRAAIRRGRALVEARLPGIAPETPAEVAGPGDALIEWTTFFGEVRRPASLRLRGKQSLAPLDGDRVWVVAEPTESAAVGTTVDRADPQFGFAEGPRCVEALLAEDLPGYAARRRREMGHSDFPAAEAERDGPGPAGAVDLRERLGRAAGAGGGPRPERVSGTAAPPPRGAGADGGDLCILEVDYDAQGERYKPFRTACRESSREAFPGQPIEGTASALTVCKSMERTNGDPRSWLRDFLRSKGLGDRVSHELRVLCDILVWAAVCDQVNLGGLMCLETAARRVAGLVAVYSDPAKPVWGRARLYTGAASSDDIAGQALQQFAARKIKEQQDAQVVLAFGKGPQRLFPLPRWRLPELPAAGSTRGLALRRRERLVFKMGNEAVGALNWLAGFRSGPSYFEPDAMQLELLRGRAPYDGAGCLARVAPFKMGFVSLSETVEGCPPFEDVAPPEVQRFLKGHPERVLRSDSPSSSVTPYFDPPLKRSANTCRQFIADLHRRGLIGWTRRPRCQVGLFFVEKDGGQRLRLILDARPGNLLFESPPGVALLNAEGLSRVEIALPEDLGPWSEGARRLLCGYSLHLGLADVKDCFHRLRLPGWLSEYFCLPEVPAYLRGAEGELWEGRTLERRDLGRVSHCVYVDNLGVASTDEPLVSDAIAQLVEGFDHQGLLLHGNSVGTDAEALGAEVSGAHWRTRVTQMRFWLIRQARQELETIRGLLIFLECDWALQWNDLAVATDSSLEAGAVSTVAEVGRVQERAGFREPVAAGAEGAADGARAARRGARETALEAAGFWRDERGKWRLAETAEGDSLAGARGLDPSFPEVPAAGLASTRWRTKQVQRWRFDGGILVKEARALVMGARRVAQSVFGAACRQLILSDNMSGPRRLSRLTAEQRSLDWLSRLGLVSLPPTPKLPVRDQGLQVLPQDWPRQVVADRDDGSSASDEQQVVPAFERRERELLKRATRRRRACGAEALLGSAAGEGQTFLERRSVFAPARSRYTQELEAFLGFCDRQPRRALTSAGEMDEAVVDCMNHLFFEGHESAKGGQVMAGLMFRFPESSKQGEAKTPRAWRCLRGWRKLAPGRSRRAWPLALWRGLAWRMVARNALQMAVFLLAMVSGYFRPSHLLTLTRGGVIPPAPGARRWWSLLLFPDNEP